MNKKILLINILCLFILFVAGCSKHDHNEHEHEKDYNEHKQENKIEERHQHDEAELKDNDTMFHLHSKKSHKSIKPTLQPITREITLMGSIKGNVKSEYITTSRLNGVVKSINFDIGDKVKKGDTLCTIISVELLKIKENFLSGVIDLKVKKESYLRARELAKIEGIEKKILSEREKDYLTAKLSLEKNRSLLKSLSFSDQKLDEMTKIENINSKGKNFLTQLYNIKSPINGVVTQRSIQFGEHITEDKVVFRVCDSSTIWGYFKLDSSNIKYLTNDCHIEVKSQFFPDKVYKVKSYKLMEEVNDQEQSLELRTTLENKDNTLKHGMYVTANIKIEGEKKLSVTSEALVSINGIKGIFIKEGDGYAFIALDNYQIDSQNMLFSPNLKEDWLVVIENAFILKAQKELNQKNVDPHAGHNH